MSHTPAFSSTKPHFLHGFIQTSFFKIRNHPKLIEVVCVTFVFICAINVLQPSQMQITNFPMHSRVYKYQNVSKYSSTSCLSNYAQTITIILTSQNEVDKYFQLWKTRFSKIKELRRYLDERWINFNSPSFSTISIIPSFSFLGLKKVSQGWEENVSQFQLSFNFPSNRKL